MGRIKKYKWLLIVLTLSVAFGGVAYAGYNVAIIASSPSDQWHACVSNTGVVRVSTMRLNSYPAFCPRSTDTVRSWNASGPSGVDGLDGTDGTDGQDGATGPSGPTGPEGNTGISGPTGPSGISAQQSGYLQYIGVYSFTFSNAGCTTFQLRLKVVPRFGSPPALNPLGPCNDLWELGGSNQMITSNAAKNYGRILSYGLDLGLRDRFGVDGNIKKVSFNSDTYNSTWYVGPQIPASKDSGDQRPCNWPTDNFTNTYYMWTDAFAVDAGDSGFICGVQANTLVPNASTLTPPPDDRLPTYEVFGTPPSL